MIYDIILLLDCKVDMQIPLAEEPKAYYNILRHDIGQEDKDMNREVTYLIEDIHAEQTVRDFLHEKGYSRQNLIEFKKHKDGILVDGEPQYMNYVLGAGNPVDSADSR